MADVPQWKIQHLEEKKSNPFKHTSNPLRGGIWKHAYFERSLNKLDLSDEQQRVLDAVVEGKNTFFTGCAGTGKSYVIASVIKKLHQLKRKIAVTASTGIAAYNIQGQTLHSWAGIGIGETTTDMNKAWSKKEQWREVDVLIIDEVSMISGDLFERLNQIAKEIRNSEEPFGDLQLILAGDFLQLPPVTKSGQIPKLLFETNAWKECISQEGIIVELTRVFRQADLEFVSILKEIRNGCCTKAIEARLQECAAPLSIDDGIEPTLLYTMNSSVDEHNMIKLNMLPAQQYVFREETSLLLDYDDDKNKTFHQMEESRALLSQILNSSPAVPEIHLAQGAQVMLLKNLSQWRVNGSRGVITGFIPSNQWIRLSRHIHMDYFKLNHPNVISNWLIRHPVVPVVRFTDGDEMPVGPEIFSVQKSVGEALRAQIPLKLAWALTIHKCQGLSLDKAKISLESTFTYGQAYVAISRVKSLSGLQLQNFSAKCVIADPKVVKWYNNLVRGYHVTRGGLTEEQLALIEKNRKEALRKLEEIKRRKL